MSYLLSKLLICSVRNYFNLVIQKSIVSIKCSNLVSIQFQKNYIHFILIIFIVKSLNILLLNFKFVIDSVRQN